MDFLRAVLDPLVGEDVDWGHIAGQAAQEHLAACWQAMEGEGEWPATMGPFDGCPTCEVRETLFAAFTALDLLIALQGQSG